jgi:hypothetical protein
MGITPPAKPELAIRRDSKTVKKIFLMILSPILLLDYDAEAVKESASSP